MERTMKARERRACATVMPLLGSRLLGNDGSALPGSRPLGNDGPLFGAGRTRNDAGISSAQTRMPSVSWAVRQSDLCRSHAAKGDIVIGAMPTPAETRDTARPRWRSNQAVAAEIIGAKKLPAEMP